MPRTRTVNVKHDAFDVYMGRAMPGFTASAFANPFKIGPDGSRAMVLRKYADWLETQPALLAKLESLRGLRLGCWCYPQACHVDVIVEKLEGPLHPQAPRQIDLFQAP